LAKTHLAGAKSFGCAPDTWQNQFGQGKDGYFGPLSDPVKMAVYESESLTDYFLNGRLLPMVEIGIKRGIYNYNDYEQTEKLAGKLDIFFKPLELSKPARVHGDLWNGNVLWTHWKNQTEAILIDPAAHGGCAEEDLAMLDLFGAPYYNKIIQGYSSINPLFSDFDFRLNLWQLYPISGHAIFFGGDYISQYRSMLNSYLY
jgi:fructosamine-3-kinase